MTDASCGRYDNLQREMQRMLDANQVEHTRTVERMEQDHRNTIEATIHIP